MVALNRKQARFVAEFLVDLNATRAAERAGYSPKTANEQGARLLAHASVAAAVAEGQAKQLEKVGVTAEQVKERLRTLAFMDPRKYFDSNGNILPIVMLDDDAAASIAGFEVIIKNARAGDGVTDTVHKIKLVDVVKPLEMLAKHFGLLAERIEHHGELLIKWQDE